MKDIVRAWFSPSETERMKHQFNSKPGNVKIWFKQPNKPGNRKILTHPCPFCKESEYSVYHEKHKIIEGNLIEKKLSHYCEKCGKYLYKEII